MHESEQALAGRMQAIVAAGRQVKAAVDSLDQIASQQLGVHCGDLRCLWLLEKGPATPGDVCAATGLTSGSVTALIDRLESAGFVERRRSANDRRSIELAIPDAQRASMAIVGDQIETTIRDYFSGRNADELDAIAAALGDFAAALAKAGSRLEAGGGQAG